MTAWAAPRRLQRAPVAIWAALALAAGILAGMLPAALSAALIAAVALLTAAGITPLAPLMLMLIVSPLRALIATERPGLLPVDAGQLAFGLFVGAWLVHRLVVRRTLLHWSSSPIALLPLPFIVAGALSLFAAQDAAAWAAEWIKWLQISVLIVLCVDVVRGRDWELLLAGLAAAGIANLIIGAYEFFGGSGALHLLINDRFFRAFGTFGQPNPFGGFMGLLTPLMAGAALGYGLRAWQAFRAGARDWRALAATVGFAACAGLFAAGVIMSWSRGAWLGLIVALAGLLFALPRRLHVSLALLGAAAALVFFAAAAGLLPGSIIERLSSAFSDTFAVSDVRGVDITTENYAVIERLAHWQAALEMARQHPWIGVGLGNYETRYPDVRLLNWKFPLGHAHNFYLNVLAETGMIGLCAYLVLWLAVFVLTWRTRRHADPVARLTAAGLFGVWCYLSVHSLTDNLYVNNLFLHLGVMLGLLAVLHRQSRPGVRVARAR